jgi:hypothetical protein
MPLIKICQSYYERNVIKERLCVDILLLISSEKQLSYEIKIVEENKNNENKKNVELSTIYISIMACRCMGLSLYFSFHIEQFWTLTVK